MTARTILTIILSQQGYWFGGEGGTIQVQWPADVRITKSVLAWRLILGEAQVAEGRLPLADEQMASRLSLTVPEVRVRTRFRWAYSVRELDDGKELASGEAALEVFPSDLLAQVRRGLVDRRLVVWDRDGSLSRCLADHAIPHRRIHDFAGLQTTRADLLLVAADQLDGSPFAQGALMGLAEAGTSVFLCTQPRVRSLAGYATRWRARPGSGLNWREAHPLLNGLGSEDLASLLDTQKSLPAVQLPVDEPALEITWWPAESESLDPVPIDALMATKTIGSGRIVLCQLPLGAWDRDPRSQILLANVLDYLQTRPGPTPAPSRRTAAPLAVPVSVPTITIPPGGSP